MTDATPVLELEGVRKSYGKEIVTEVLHGIDLSVGPSEIVALVGPSGSGKSTLLNLLGLLDRPTSGIVRIQGRETRRLDDAALTRLRGQSLGFVFQLHHLLPAFTALENVMMPLVIDRGRAEPAMRERARAMLARVGLGDRGDSRPSKLSGGQQQRVAIARALVMGPPLVLADEPTGNLDTETSSQIFALLEQLNRELGIAFLIVTHDARVAARCTRVVELVDGRIVRDERNGPAQSSHAL